MTIGLELKKIRRSGVILTLLATGLLGSLYAIVIFSVRKETMLSLPLPPMNILLIQLYGVIMMINLFGIILSTSLIYDIEHSGNANRKMKTLPISMVNTFAAKFLIISCLLAFSTTLQSFAFAYVGQTYLPLDSFDYSVLITFMMYCYIIALPAVAIMLFISSKNENIWIPLGIGVAGFISGLAMSMGKVSVFLVNPFVLIMNPAISTSIEIDTFIIIISIIEACVFFIAGLISEKHSHYE